MAEWIAAYRAALRDCEGMTDSALLAHWRRHGRESDESGPAPAIWAAVNTVAQERGLLCFDAIGRAAA